MAKQKTRKTTDVQTVDLSQKAVLVLLGTSQWTGRVVDRKATKKVIDDAGASHEAGRFNKSLLPGNELIKKIAKNISDFRQQYHYTVTLPWGDDGWRLLPARKIGEYRQRFRQAQDIHSELVGKFVAQYPEYVEAAKQTLGKLYDTGDYPAPNLINEKYRFAADWSNIDTAEDLRVQVSEDVAKEIRNEIEATTKAKLTHAVEDTYKRAHSAVAAVVDRLTDDKTGDPKIFRDSLISNLAELAEVLPALNITGDQNLARVADAIHTKLANLNPQELRDDPERRKETVKTAQQILDDLNGVL